MRRGPSDAGEPKVKASHEPEGRVVSLDVRLDAGQSIRAARAPAYFSEGLVAAPEDGCVRWEAPGAGLLCFAAGDGASFARLDVSKSRYMVAAGLIALWTVGVRLEPFDLPDVPGFTRVSGEGRIWLLIPGHEVRLPYLLNAARHPSIVVDPARLAWAKAYAESLAPTPGPDGRPWIRLSGDVGNALLHSGERPGAHVPGSPG